MGCVEKGDAQDEEMIGLIRTVEDEYMNLLGTLGVQSKSFRRETRKAFKRIVTEIYSPPRVTRMASLMPSMKLLPGYAFDISQDDPNDGEPWDFNDSSKREKARRMI